VTFAAMTPKPTSARTDEVLAAAVDRLRNALAAALAAADWPNDGGRASAIAELEAIFAFAEEVDELRGQELTPLRILHLALCNLDQGATPLMLRPRRVSGRRPDPIGRLMTKAIAAAGMTLLMDVGLGRVEAARQVAEELHRGGVTLGGKHPWRTVASWRDQVKAAHSAAASAVHRGVVDAIQAERWPPAPGEVDPHGAAHALLAFVRRLLAQGAF
jgi:hypothetical protein